MLLYTGWLNFLGHVQIAIMIILVIIISFIMLVGKTTVLIVTYNLSMHLYARRSMI